MLSVLSAYLTVLTTVSKGYLIKDSLSITEFMCLLGFSGTVISSIQLLVNCIITIHRKILVWKNWQIWQIVSYTPKIFLPVFTNTPFGICTDCSLLAKVFLTNSFYLYGSPKFSFAKYFPCTLANVRHYHYMCKWIYAEMRFNEY